MFATTAHRTNGRTIDCSRAADRVGPERKPFWPPPVESQRSAMEVKCRFLTQSMR